jgi:DnaJ-class molecular chaperone
MYCTICKGLKQCQHCKGSGKEPMPKIAQVSYRPPCSHCGGTGVCPSYRGR